MPLLQVVGHDDEEHAARAQRAQRLGRELPRIVDAAHVLEHLIGVDDVGAGIGHRHRRRPRLDDLQALVAQHVDQDGAGFDRGVAPAGGDGALAERAVAGTDLDHIAGAWSQIGGAGRGGAARSARGARRRRWSASFRRTTCRRSKVRANVGIVQERELEPAGHGRAGFGELAQGIAVNRPGRL